MALNPKFELKILHGRHTHAKSRLITCSGCSTLQVAVNTPHQVHFELLFDSSLHGLEEQSWS